MKNTIKYLAMHTRPITKEKMDTDKRIYLMK